jgi:hypothetical protein
VLPLADDLGLTVDTSCERNDVECVVDAVHSHKRPGDILIVWRHGDMGDIVEALGATEQIEYPKKRYVICFDSCAAYQFERDAFRESPKAISWVL